MNRIRVREAIVFAALVALASVVSGQPGMGKYQQLYAQGAVETLSGVVESVYLDTPPGVRTQAVYLSLKMDRASFPVQLGPEWFVQKLPTKFEKGDKVEVTGAKVTVQGKPLILAAEVKKDAEAVVFRNSSGVPVWSGQ